VFYAVGFNIHIFKGHAINDAVPLPLNPPPYLRLLFSPIPAKVPESAHSQQLLCCSLCAYFLGNEVTSGNLR
jgi:hypothetical protein